MTRLWRNPTVRAFAYQVALLAAVAWLLLTGIQNALTNIANRGVSTGFSFLQNEAGISIPETPSFPQQAWAPIAFLSVIAIYLALRTGVRRWHIPGRTKLAAHWAIALATGLSLTLIAREVNWTTYRPTEPYYVIIITAILNSIRVGAIAFVAAISVGFILGVCSLSTNWLLRNIVRWSTELLRNVPILLHIFFWYTIVLAVFPPVRSSFSVGGIMYLTNRGVFYPTIDGDYFSATVTALIASFIVYILCRLLWTNWPCLVASSIVFVATLLWNASWSIPELRGFNFAGGTFLSPEFAALFFGLVVYYSAFIADIVRSGIRSIPLGQWEAARAIGLKRILTIRFVIIPQALRAIIPPLSNQMLGLVKDTSIGVAIAYPELLSVSRTIINQTGQAMEVMLIVMLFYLVVNLLISAGMNVYNQRVRIRER
jgi:general L-amino acid transport system permease protein